MLDPLKKLGVVGLAPAPPRLTRPSHCSYTYSKGDQSQGLNILTTLRKFRGETVEVFLGRASLTTFEGGQENRLCS